MEKEIFTDTSLAQLEHNCQSIESLNRSEIWEGMHEIDKYLWLRGRNMTIFGKAILNYKKGYCFSLVGQKDKAISTLNEVKTHLSCNLLKDHKMLYNIIGELLHKIRCGTNSIAVNGSYLLYQSYLIKIYHEDNPNKGLEFLHTLYNKPEFKAEFDNPDSLEQRKAIAIIKDNTMPTPTKMLFCLEKTVATDILGLEFPFGHPVVNQVYYAHPVRSKYYVPASDYDKIVYEEKVDEYRRLVAGLGATKITIYRADGLYLDNTSESKFGAEASVGGKRFGVSGSYDTQEQNKNSYSNKFSFENTITLRPTGKPTVPKGIYWLNYEKGWKYLRDGRLNNTLTSYSEIISTEENRFISSQEATIIATEAKLLFTQVSGRVHFEDSYTSSSKQTQVLKFEVEF